MAVLMNILVRLVGMSSEDGATSLMYASTAAQSELEGALAAMHATPHAYCRLAHKCTILGTNPTKSKCVYFGSITV